MRVLERGHWQEREGKHMVETRKQTQQMKQQMNKGGHKEVMHACERDNAKSFFFKQRKMVVQKKKTQESEG